MDKTQTYLTSILDELEIEFNDITNRQYINISNILQEIYDSGYDSGKKEGNKEGYDQGYEDAYEEIDDSKPIEVENGWE